MTTLFEKQHKADRKLVLAIEAIETTQISCNIYLEEYALINGEWRQVMRNLYSNLELAMAQYSSRLAH